MNATQRILLRFAGFALSAATVCTVGAADTNKTFRTTGYFVGLTQATNPVSGKPLYENISFAGHNLVNLAMGRSLTDKTHPNQVMAMTFECDLSAASLVVYDLASSNILTTIAASTVVDSVKHQDLQQKGPNRAHFVAMLQIAQVGNPTNGLAGGYFTVAGRLNLDPATGCPHPVIVVLDRDSLDKVVDDIELPASLDPDTEVLIERTGLAHLIGVVDAITSGKTNTVLVPYGGLSIRRELPDGSGVGVVSSSAN